MYQGVAGGTLTRHATYRVSRVPASPGLRPQASCGRGRGARAQALDNKTQPISWFEFKMEPDRSRDCDLSFTGDGRGWHTLLPFGLCELHLMACTLTRHATYRVSRVPDSPGLRLRTSRSRGRGARRASARHRYADSCSDTKREPFVM